MEQDIYDLIEKVHNSNDSVENFRFLVIPKVNGKPANCIDFALYGGNMGLDPRSMHDSAELSEGNFDAAYPLNSLEKQRAAWGNAERHGESLKEEVGQIPNQKPLGTSCVTVY